MKQDHVGERFGNYKLISLLGRGGFAEVYLGQHVRLTKQAAVKLLRATPSADAKDLQKNIQAIVRSPSPSASPLSGPNPIINLTLSTKLVY